MRKDKKLNKMLKSKLKSKGVRRNGELTKETS